VKDFSSTLNATFDREQKFVHTWNWELYCTDRWAAITSHKRGSRVSFEAGQTNGDLNAFTPSNVMKFGSEWKVHWLIVMASFYYRKLFLGNIRVLGATIIKKRCENSSFINFLSMNCRLYLQHNKLIFLSYFHNTRVYPKVSGFSR
jgi:hypothetical protein